MHIAATMISNWTPKSGPIEVRSTINKEYAYRVYAALLSLTKSEKKAIPLKFKGILDKRFEETPEAAIDHYLGLSKNIVPEDLCERVRKENMHLKDNRTVEHLKTQMKALKEEKHEPITLAQPRTEPATQGKQS
jgi:hypothetical protein